MGDPNMSSEERPMDGQLVMAILEHNSLAHSSAWQSIVVNIRT
jgi:hypothetical protein